MSLNENDGLIDDGSHSSSRNSPSSSHHGQLRASVSQSRVDVARAIGNHVLNHMNESINGQDGSRIESSVKRIESVRSCCSGSCEPKSSIHIDLSYIILCLYW